MNDTIHSRHENRDNPVKEKEEDKVTDRNCNLKRFLML